MNEQKDIQPHSPQREPTGSQGHSGAELPNREKYAPHIPLMTDLWTNGSNILALKGMIRGLILGAGAHDNDLATDDLIKRHILPEAKKNIEALAAAIKEYERRTFKAPILTAEQYDAMTRAERLGAAP